MQPIRSTKCTVSDWKTLQHIGLQTFSDSFQHLNTPEDFSHYISKAFNGEKIKSELQNPDSGFYFFYKDKELAGYLKLNEGNAQTEPHGDHALEIERIYLYKKHHGNGYGKNMMDFALQIAKEKGKTKIWLGVWEENHAAVGFYKKMGFKEFGKHSFMIGDDEQTDLLMELDVARISKSGHV